jgi:thiol-disulfide isomerase/thioredoxin
MKKIVLVLLTTLLVISCKKEGYEITVRAEGVENGKNVYLQTLSDNGTINIDTTKVENGIFKFEGQLKEGIELALISIDQVNPMPFILENGSIKISINKDTIQNSNLSGTYNNEKVQEYNDKIMQLVDKRMQFQKLNNDKYNNAIKANDTLTIRVLMDSISKFDEEKNLFDKKFITENNKSFFACYLLQNLISKKIFPNSEIIEIYTNLDKSVKETKTGKKVNQLLTELNSTEIGSIAPDFSGKNPEGKEISLKESLGKVTIIDFWASWCGPCRVENPNVVAMYKELHDKGLNIIGVSLDNPNGAQAWKDAIAKDGLIWNHVSNLQGWKDPIAVQYKVQSIPATFILNKDGAIVAKNLRGEELKAKVKELLGVE